MAAYGITVHCKDCGKDHLVFLRIDLSSGPGRKRTVAEVLQAVLALPKLKRFGGTTPSAAKLAGSLHWTRMRMFSWFHCPSSDIIPLVDNSPDCLIYS